MFNKTKIVCTIGPATNTPEAIKHLILAGMNVARVNFSHGTHEEHEKVIAMIRDVASKLNRHVGILADTKGPEIRTGEFENGGVSYKRGEQIKIFKKEMVGNKEGFHVTTPEFYKDLNVNDIVLVDDGKVRLQVIHKEPDYLLVEVKNSGTIKNRKGINTPGVHISMPFISKKDSSDIAFSVKMDVDMIALSFVRTAEDVNSIRSILKFLDGQDIDLISKIESQTAMDNIDQILDVSDGIMVARGDLGVEVSLQLVPLYQKLLIQKANEKGKPVITATHMLESMMQNPRPTRAEASDVANAILDGSDAIMLSGETAAGEYPVESVAMMDTIAKAIEPTMPYDDILRKSILTGQQTVSDTIGIAVSQAALSLPKVKVIVAFTETGGTARRLCKFRPSVPILAVSELRATCEKLTYYRGVFAYYHPKVEYSKYDDVAIDVAKKFGYKSGDTIVITSGYLQKHGSTNTIRIIDIP